MRRWKSKTLVGWLSDLIHNQGGLELMALCVLFFGDRGQSFQVRYFGFVLLNAGSNAFEILFLIFKNWKTFTTGGKINFIFMFFADTGLLLLGMWIAVTHPQIIYNSYTQAALSFTGFVGMGIIIHRVRNFLKNDFV
jgi:hypothetical protein